MKFIVRLGLKMLQYSVESLLCRVPGVPISFILALIFAMGVEQALEYSFSCKCSYLTNEAWSFWSSSDMKHFSAVATDLAWDFLIVSYKGLASLLVQSFSLSVELSRALCTTAWCSIFCGLRHSESVGEVVSQAVELNVDRLVGSRAGIIM